MIVHANKNPQNSQKIQLTHSAMNPFRHCRIHFFPYTLNNPNAPKKPPHPLGFPQRSATGTILRQATLAIVVVRAPELMGLNSYEILLDIEN